MDIECFNYLHKYYSRVYEYLTLKRKLKQESVLISMFHMKSNAAYDIFSNAAILSSSIPKFCYERLMSEGYIRISDKPRYSIITCKGVWEVERTKKSLNLDSLLKSIDTKFFDVFPKNSALNDKEKIILITMIALRSFSESSALDLKKSDRVLSELQQLIVSAHRILKKYQIVSDPEDTLFGSKLNEPPVSNLIRHREQLVKKTKNIYQIARKRQQQYYLNLSHKSKISEEDLIFLFDLIFKNRLVYDLLNDLKEFFTNTAYDKAAYFYDYSTHQFAAPKYDEVINEALHKYFDKCNTE